MKNTSLKIRKALTQQSSYYRTSIEKENRAYEKQLAQLKEVVMEIDPKAFIILQDARQVLGDGFKRYDRYEL